MKLNICLNYGYEFNGKSAHDNRTSAIVSLDRGEYDYQDIGMCVAAKDKLCNFLGLDKSKVVVFDYKYLGHVTTII